MRKVCVSSLIRPGCRVPVFLAAAATLVYVLISALPRAYAVNTGALGENTVEDAQIEILRDPGVLPDQAKRIRHAMMVAAMTGDIHAMRLPIEMNEIPPLFADRKIADPIEYWTSISGDGEGREILSIVIKLFRAGFVRQSPGTGDEIFIWPYFAKLPIKDLTPAQQVELMTIVSPERFKAMQASGTYDFYRIGIAHDGTWHYFTQEDQ